SIANGDLNFTSTDSTVQSSNIVISINNDAFDGHTNPFSLDLDGQETLSTDVQKPQETSSAIKSREKEGDFGRKHKQNHVALNETVTHGSVSSSALKLYVSSKKSYSTYGGGFSPPPSKATSQGTNRWALQLLR
ncbi:hypothetical protein ABZP36_022097, partial [Zizania latifolia]